jgi:signal transduction histidine kinase
MSAHIDSTIQTVRRISTELRPGILDHLGLVAALEWQANEFQTRTGIRCDVHGSVQDPLLESHLATAFFRIFQETLTNVIRHAGATHVSVHLREQDDRIVMEVRDNGRGITADEITNTRSLGLLGMKERAALLGGEFRVGPMRGGGTRVTVSMPARRAMQSNLHEDSFDRRSRSRSARVETNTR